MPTDLQIILARRCEAKRQSDSHTTLLLVSFTICLAVLVLLFVSHSFAQAVELIGVLEF